MVNNASILYQRYFLSLRNKRFRSVSEQRKTEELAGFSVLAARKIERESKNERGERERGRNNTHTTTTASRNIGNKKTKTAVFCYKPLFSAGAPSGYPIKNSNNRKIESQGDSPPYDTKRLLRKREATSHPSLLKFCRCHWFDVLYQVHYDICYRWKQFYSSLL